MDKPTSEEFKEWQRLPVTRWVFVELEGRRNEVRNDMADGTILSETPGLTAQLAARAVGEIAGINFILNKDFLPDIDHDS